MSASGWPRFDSESWDDFNTPFPATADLCLVRPHDRSAWAKIVSVMAFLAGIGQRCDR
jgi:hypothetical protein